jgi:hypothetical protein
MKVRRLDHVGVDVADLGRAERFYATLDRVPADLEQVPPER